MVDVSEKSSSDEASDVSKKARVSKSGAERVNALEETVGSLDAKLAALFTLVSADIESRSAKNVPTSIRKGTDVEGTETVGVLEADSEIEVVKKELGDPLLMKKLDRLAFDMQKLTIHVHEVSDKNADQVFQLSVNGNPQTQAVLFRGKEAKVPRCLVEVMMRARPVRYGNEESNVGGVQSYRNPSYRGFLYPFTVLKDPSPHGAAWLEKLRLE